MPAINRYYYPTKFQSRGQFLSLGVKCVFISHQKRDATEARKVADYLQTAGAEIFFDEYDMDLRIQHEKGNPREVTKAITNGINNSSHMLVIVSPNTLSSPWVSFEIGYGYDKTELGVLCLKGIPKGKLPEYLRTARIIRDIYDFNLMIERLTGMKHETLLEKSLLSEHSNKTNPLSNVMDSFIHDTY
jgi:hypothetical protein